MLFEKQMVDYVAKKLYVRYDNAGGIFYFAPEDFPGLESHGYTFPSQQGYDLKGYFYHYPDPIPGRVVVFDHGMGNGHRAYMREIETLCKAGYLVFSYDHTGCMASGGKNINAFAQSLADLDDCMKALKQEKALAGYTYSVMGHSWGGFSTMNIGALHPDITHLVAMSGFISVERIVKQSLGGLKAYAPAVVAEELRRQPRYARFNALESLEKTGAKVLIIHSQDDKTVHKSQHFDPLQEKFAGDGRITLLLLDGKNHNPGYTEDAVAYKDGFFQELTQAGKKKQLNTAQAQQAFMARWDWMRMTQQDEAVWQRIFAHLQS